MSPATQMKLVLAGVAAALLGAGARADRIYRTSGAPLEDVTVVSETLAEVRYKEEGKGPEKAVPSESVVRVEYDRFPAAVGEAEAAAQDGDAEGALERFEAYATDGKPDKRYPWAQAYAAHRAVTLRGTLGDLEGAAAAADRLISGFPESRYVPAAYVAKADALFRLERMDQAQAALTDFERLITAKGLSKRWALECRLAQVLTDRALSGVPRRDRLEKIEQDAGQDFPTVRCRAAVARAESFLAGGGEGPDAIGKARAVFEEVIDDPGSDEESLAAAHTGLGEILFSIATGPTEKEELRAALLAFMRVAVLFEEQSRYAPKAMFYAGRCFERIGGEGSKDNAVKLYRRVLRDYADSPWAAEARNFLK